jgi:hypothetical protein
MIDACSTRLLQLGREIAALQQARQSLPAGYRWTGDAQIGALRAEKERLENLVAMPDLAGGRGSGPESEEEHEIPAAETGASVEAGGPPFAGSEATSELPAEPEADTGTPVEDATPRDSEPEENLINPQHSSSSPAVPVEPVTQPAAPVEAVPQAGAVTQTDSVLPDREHVLAFLRREQEQKGCVTPRSLMRWNNRRFHNREAAVEVLNRLVDSGDLEWGEPGDVARVRNAPGGP